jgi:hypothetical protein
MVYDYQGLPYLGSQLRLPLGITMVLNPHNLEDNPYIYYNFG